MKTYIFLDTNILDKQFTFNPDIEELLRYVHRNDDCEIILPEIVSKELIDHAKDIISSNNMKIQSVNRLKEWNEQSPVRMFETDLLLTRYEKQLNENFTVFKPDSAVYEKVFTRYFDGLKPFENRKQEFKDGLLWESLLLFKEQHHLESAQYFFITNNFADFAADKRNKKVLHTDLQKEFPQLQLENSVKEFLAAQEYYSEFVMNDCVKSSLLLVLQQSMEDLCWRLGETLYSYVFKKNQSSKEEFFLNSVGRLENIAVSTASAAKKSDHYVHVPITADTQVSLYKRMYVDPSYGYADEHQETVSDPVRITCEAVFSLEGGQYEVKALDKIVITERN
ncbi:hypothetical protein SporoP37_01400 [Sporosarcina sp. P37]|uniref:PIN domain-containing protein n=1 Tax=unclassified Sporosarcina TaxID=2647733 RepID=UPI0009BF35E0|nr:MULTISPECIES: PIN domain-containing protein [unclassified Sporosarcina]ARD46955.1 hypothetical protein SporoP33_00995 [Sporosarcina sp. P33]ARK23480.1 hypothetical protein SporoP37_01400 [Sporosarcina sp. P37]PID18691.1 DUF4935 domain-containing protein [Sporosarcina sp. P35]